MNKDWPEQFVIDTSSHWVETYPRPAEGDCHPTALATRQAAWDAANVKHQRIVKRGAEIVASREAAAQEKREAAEARRREADDKALAALTAQLRKGYFRAPGASEDGFQAALPDLLEAHRRESAVSGDDAARRAQAGLYRRF